MRRYFPPCASIRTEQSWHNWWWWCWRRWCRQSISYRIERRTNERGESERRKTKKNWLFREFCFADWRIWLSNFEQEIGNCDRKLSKLLSRPLFPWEGFKIIFRKSDDRRPIAIEHLLRLFTQKSFRKNLFLGRKFVKKCDLKRLPKASVQEESNRRRNFRNGRR